MIPIFVGLFMVASVIVGVFLESFHRFERVAVVENVSDTAASVATSVYAKTYDTELHHCMAEKLAELETCPNIPIRDECIAQEAFFCDESLSVCLSDAESLCKTYEKEFKQKAQRAAEAAVDEVAQTLSNGVVELEFTDEKARANVRADYTPHAFFGIAGEIYRYSVASLVEN